MKGLLAAMVLLFAIASPAAADPPWSTPVDIGPASDYVYGPSLRFTEAGVGMASWLARTQPSGAEDGDATGDPVVVAPCHDGDRVREAAGGVPVRVVSTRDTIAAGPALDASGNGLVLRTRVLGSDDNGYRKERLGWSAVRPDGTVGSVHALARATVNTSPAIAVDRRGDALAAWVEYRPPRPGGLWGTNRVMAAWRSAGGDFGRPLVLRTTQYLSYEHGGTVRAAMSPAGRAIVTYDDARFTRGAPMRRVLAWVRTPRTRFGPTLVVGPQDGFADVALLVTARGRAVVVWGSQDGGEEANKPWIVRASALAPGARRFAPVQVLDRGEGINRSMGDVVAAAGADGRVLAAWSRVGGASGRMRAFPVLAATSDAHGRFAPAQTLAPYGAVGGAAVRSDGTQIVTWAHVVEYQVTDQAMAAVRAPSAAAFGAPEAIAAADHALPPVVAFDPKTASPVVAWPARPRGADPSNGIGTTAILRIARRTTP
jgi:hypothetical protein